MPIKHKYQQQNFKNGFQTHSSILDIVPYDPEVIFIGTFNHGWSWNYSDFYYGRGMYMWSALANLFLHNKNLISKKREVNNDILTQSQLFEICKIGKIVFADIVKGINDNIPTIEQSELKNVIVNNQYVWKGYKDASIDYMATQGWIEDNISDIVAFINKTKTIKHVYFTFKSGKWLVDKMMELQVGLRSDVTICSIFTPTSNGFRKNLSPPFNRRVWSLTHCWVWNGIEHSILINKPNYGHLDHKWLNKNGVDPNNF